MTSDQRPDAAGTAWENLPEECQNLSPKWVVNGFPKSGLHYVTNLLRPVASPMPRGQLHEDEWVGTFRDHSWSNDRAGMEYLCFRLARLEHSHYLKGHLGYSEELERFLWLAGFAHVFIFRDLRDVAVSQAFHILSDDDRLSHPGKAEYKQLYSDGGMAAVLQAVIAGHDRWPGLLERWHQYAGWTAVPWSFNLRYEDLRADPALWAGRLLEYGVMRVAGIVGFQLADTGPAFDTTRAAMAEASADTSHSATFRKGIVGGWREHFTPELTALFKAHDTENWLHRLGYVPDGEDW